MSENLKKQAFQIDWYEGDLHMVNILTEDII